MELKNEEALTIIGGATFSAALVTAVTSLLKFVYSVGQSIGSSLRKSC